MSFSELPHKTHSTCYCSQISSNLNPTVRTWILKHAQVFITYSYIVHLFFIIIRITKVTNNKYQLMKNNIRSSGKYSPTYQSLRYAYSV
jgi:hypothetical protein